MFQEQAPSSAGIADLAEKHGVSPEAAQHMLRALEAGGGGMAQFDHPEFGGMGQWSAGGMVMVGRMNDHALKARVTALCADLVSALPARGRHGGREGGLAASSQSQSQSSGFGGGFAPFGGGSGDWWPEGLGRPGSVGAQNATRYATFPESRRLAVETGGRVALYDTGEHVITGAAQQQGGASTFTFSGPNGTVSLDRLRRVEMAGRDEPDRVAAKGRELHPDRFESTREAIDPPARPAEHPSPSAPSLVSPPSPTPAPHGPTDVLTLLERLSELHRKGVLTDAEFSGKKTELLARL